MLYPFPFTEMDTDNFAFDFDFDFMSVQLLKLLSLCCEISKYVVLFVKCLYSVESAML